MRAVVAPGRYLTGPAGAFSEGSTVEITRQEYERLHAKGAVLPAAPEPVPEPLPEPAPEPPRGKGRSK